ncbi:MAG: signal peptidase I [Theionarchaea archaeon]|nr:signal peptidase I [Theionarchaea archaeon]MBU6999133.1 signal peptidase I [Theionarchaea archaeon]MBU7019494.1 signal peptidase I [Theionarchaea archaeon]MBU7040792.1 signal peptidase I [Theionarchaea archaeon]
MEMENELREIGEGFLIAVVIYLIIQASLMVTLGVERPLYVVISGSMEPTYYEGDILVVKRANPYTIEEGDIIVFESPSGGIPIVHRVFDVEIAGGIPYFVTKGDHNNSLDVYYQFSYPGVPPEQIIGKPIFRIPKLGWGQIKLRELGMYLRMQFKNLGEVIRCPQIV